MLSIVKLTTYIAGFICKCITAKSYSYTIHINLCICIANYIMYY